jgi:hypothetical protein
VNHRGLQRALFRMQLDPGFAARLRSGDRAAANSTRLDPAELEWLRAADPAAVSADREGLRRAQLLRNLAGELALSLAAARESDWLATFPASDHFHRAIAQDAPLPLAFAEYLAERVASRSALVRSLVELELTLARARRGLRSAARAGVPGRRASAAGLVLAPSAWLVDLADGTFAWASALREALDRGARLPDAPRGLPAGARETVLIAADEPPARSLLRPVRSERLEPAVADFLRECARGLDARGIAGFCAAHGLEAEAVERVVEELVAEGVLQRADP